MLMKESVTSPWALEQCPKNNFGFLSFSQSNALLSYNTKALMLFIYPYLGLGNTQI